MLKVEVEMFPGKKGTPLENLCSPVLIVTSKDGGDSEDRVIIPLPERMLISDAEKVVSLVKQAIEKEYTSLEDLRKLYK